MVDANGDKPNCGSCAVEKNSLFPHIFFPNSNSFGVFSHKSSPQKTSHHVVAVGVILWVYFGLTKLPVSCEAFWVAGLAELILLDTS